MMLLVISEEEHRDMLDTWRATEKRKQFLLTAEKASNNSNLSKEDIKTLNTKKLLRAFKRKMHSKKLKGEHPSTFAAVCRLWLHERFLLALTLTFILKNCRVSTRAENEAIRQRDPWKKC